MDTVLSALYRAQFGMSDVLRRVQGDLAGTFIGLGPTECQYKVVTSGWHWRVRDYGGEDQSRSPLIIAAPIKKPYIWDLAPSASTINHCLHQNLHVQLLEWMPASQRTGYIGLNECVAAIKEAVATATRAARGSKPFLIGHSLGGTLAAIYAAFMPESIGGLVLLGAPLCFEPSKSEFRDALVSLVPSELSDADIFPGSLLSQASALASPHTFIWSRLMDAAISVVDPRAIEVHARVERWALDEVPLPGKLVHQIIEWLYRENRFCRGTLNIGEKLVGPSSLSTPTLAIINTSDEVAPPTAVKPFIEAMPAKNGRIIEYPGEVGACLQHLAILIGRQARANVWPQILSWLKSLS